MLGSNPPEEHSILIIGFDSDEFVFNDPDGNVSSAHGQGFGALFFVGGKLTTAKNAADMPVSPGGSHAGGEHRYQILTLNTV